MCAFVCMIVCVCVRLCALVCVLARPQVNFLGRIRHPNVVKLLGYGSDNTGGKQRRWLVYEYMNRGSIVSLIPDKDLDWRGRVKIAVFVAGMLLGGLAPISCHACAMFVYCC